jgi:hypothetical protein
MLGKMGRMTAGETGLSDGASHDGIVPMNHAPDTPQDRSGPDGPRQWKTKELREMEARAFPEGFTLRDEANAIVAKAFRNGPLEDLHAGKWSELLTDDELSRITDEEMKPLMIFACEQVAQLLHIKKTDVEEYYLEMMSYNWRFCRGWER